MRQEGGDQCLGVGFIKQGSAVSAEGAVLVRGEVFLGQPFDEFRSEPFIGIRVGESEVQGDLSEGGIE